MRTQILASFLLVAIAVAVLCTPALAQPQLIQTGCDTLSMDPMEVKITFAVMNPDPFLVCKVRFTPYWDAENESEVCPVSECDGPDPWYCFGPPSRAIWEGLALPPDELRGCVEQGETQEGFSFVMQGGYCWYHVAYFEPAMLQPFYWEIINFACDRSVQVHASTWGELKAIYR